MTLSSNVCKISYSEVSKQSFQFFNLKLVPWLPILKKIVFKLAIMVSGLCPSYLAEDCILLSPTRGQQNLRSDCILELLVPGTQTVTFGPLAFAVAGPWVWNSLPLALREPTHLFNCSQRD